MIGSPINALVQSQCGRTVRNDDPLHMAGISASSPVFRIPTPLRSFPDDRWMRHPDHGPSEPMVPGIGAYHQVMVTLLCMTVPAHADGAALRRSGHGIPNIGITG